MRNDNAANDRRAIALAVADPAIPDLPRASPSRRIARFGFLRGTPGFSADRALAYCIPREAERARDRETMRHAREA